MIFRRITAEVTPPAEHSLRLVGGDSNFEGRVEIFHEGQWGTVCDDEWDIADANVVCQELFGVDAIEAKWRAFFGEGSDPIWMGDVECVGDETELRQCPFRGWGEEDCDHDEDAGVICEQSSAPTSTPAPTQVPMPAPTYSPTSTPAPTIVHPLRLVGGSSVFEGRVEILHDGQWGTVCDDSWDLDDANVVCQQLFGVGALEAKDDAFFGRRRRERDRRSAGSRLAVLYGPRVQGPSRPDAGADRDDDDRYDAAPLLRGRPS